MSIGKQAHTSFTAVAEAGTWLRFGKLALLSTITISLAIVSARSNAACWGVARVELNGFVPDLFVRPASVFASSKFTWRYGYQVVSQEHGGDFCGIWARSTVAGISLVNTYDRNQLSGPFEWAAVGPADGGLAYWTLGAVPTSFSPNTGVIDIAKNDAGDVNRLYVPIGSANVYVRDNPVRTWFPVTASSQNRIGSAISISHSLLDGRPEAIVFVSLVFDESGPPLSALNHPVALRYDDEHKFWKIQFEDETAIPDGAKFHVRIDPAGTRVSAKSGQNSLFSMLAIRDRRADHNPRAVLMVTPVNNGVKVPNPISVRYVEPHWFITNTNGLPMTDGAEYNVRIFGSGIVSGESGVTATERPHVYGVTTDTKSLRRTFFGMRMLDHPQLNARANATAMITRTQDPNNEATATIVGHAALWYAAGLGRWAILNTDGSAMSQNAAFHVWTDSGSWNLEGRPILTQ